MLSILQCRAPRKMMVNLWWRFGRLSRLPVLPSQVWAGHTLLSLFWPIDYSKTFVLLWNQKFFHCTEPDFIISFRVCPKRKKRSHSQMFFVRNPDKKPRFWISVFEGMTIFLETLSSDGRCITFTLLLKQLTMVYWCCKLSGNYSSTLVRQSFLIYDRPFQKRNFYNSIKEKCGCLWLYH